MCSAESNTEPNNGGSTPNKTPDTTNRNPNRRSNKPIMEKRRRARINNCLNELKAILLEAMRKDPARHSKLEKADILELTVSHLKALHRHSSTGVENTTRFRAGFAECAAEVGRFLSSHPHPHSQKVDGMGMGMGVDTHTGGRLLSHLAACLNNNPNTGLPGNHTHTPLGSLDSPGNVTTTLNVPANAQIISLVPNHLPSGEIALVVSGFNTHPRQAMTLSCNPTPQQPMLSPDVPLELTVSSSSSACSLSPNYPTENRYGMAIHPNLPNQPLALVTPKREPTDLSCWRPW